MSTANSIIHYVSSFSKYTMQLQNLYSGLMLETTSFFLYILISLQTKAERHLFVRLDLNQDCGSWEIE